MQRHPLIVLDGPDGSGKTTLARHLVKEHKAQYRHLTYRFKDRMHLYHTAALELCLRDLEHGPVVLDRWWPSEVIYAAAFRGGTKWATLGRMLDRVAMRHRAIYVICLPANRSRYLEHFETLRSQRPEMYDAMAAVYDRYVDWLRWYGKAINVCQYDWMTSGHDLAKATAIIMARARANLDGFVGDFITRREDRRFAGNPWGTAKVLMVGDQSKPKGRRQVWPFFDAGHSSVWLTNELEHLNVPELNLAWINMHGADGRVQWTDEELELLTHEMATHVVALGERVAKSMARLGFDRPLTLNHPQYYRRFDPTRGREDMRAIFRSIPGAIDARKERPNAAANLHLQQRN